MKKTHSRVERGLLDGENGCVSGRGTSIQPRQSNYQQYRLPVGIDASNATPLYLVVAWWGWALQRPFSREDVAVAFGMDVRRAGDVMSYIRRARTDVVSCRQHYERMSTGGRQRYLKILIEPTLGESANYVQSAVTPPPRQNGNSLQELRRDFLRRPLCAAKTEKT